MVWNYSLVNLRQYGRITKQSFLSVHMPIAKRPLVNLLAIWPAATTKSPWRARQKIN
jgi:hypothetical protein